jgi:hypothetical protein
VENGEASILAVMESILAVSAAMFIAFRWDYTTHIAFGAIVAPFLMMRTDRSTILGARFFDRARGWLEKDSDGVEFPERLTPSYFGDALVMAVVALLLAASALVIRVAATLITTARYPGESLKAIPSNWRRLALAVDISRPPELIPGIDIHMDVFSEDHSWISFDYVLRRLRDGLLTLSKDPAREFPYLMEVEEPRRGLAIRELRLRAMLSCGFFLLPVLVLGYVPALAYRWSFKATSIVYLPLIWVARTTLRKSLELKDWLKQIKEGDELEKTRRVWSVFVLGLLGTKALYVLGWISLEALAAKIPEGNLRELYLMPEVIPWWQWAAFINGLLTFSLLYFASWAMPRIEGEKPAWKHENVERTVQGLTFTRGVLSYYSIGCVLYIFVAGSFDLGWPPLGTKFLPFT